MFLLVSRFLSDFCFRCVSLFVSSFHLIQMSFFLDGGKGYERAQTDSAFGTSSGFTTPPADGNWWKADLYSAFLHLRNRRVQCEYSIALWFKTVGNTDLTS